MSYLPLLLDLKRKNVLLVGGGQVALFKFSKLLEAVPASLKVVAKKISPEILQENRAGLMCEERPFEISDLDGMDLVIVAVNDLSMQEDIYNLCQERKILCNCVDDIGHCDFIFPSVIRRGDITIAISSSGKVPGFSVSLKDYINSLLPSELEMKLNDLFILRNSLPGGSDRMKRIREESDAFFERLQREKFE